MSKLNEFIAKKRVFYVPPVPPLETSNDTYIKSFCESIDFHSSSSSSSSSSSNQNTTTAIIASSLTIEDEIKIISPVKVLDDESTTTTTNNNNVTMLRKFKIHNLVYRMTEKELIDFASKYNIKIVKVEMGSDVTPGLPAGTAIAYMSNEMNSSDILSTLNGEDCLGRVIRVSEVSAANKSRESFGQTRYFDRDISVKCNNCFEVGHRQYECPHPLLESFCCHLCGGSHDPGDCSSIICFRCNRFGHHSKFCSNSRALKESVCTLCGLTTHSTSACVIFASSERGFRKGGKRSGKEKEDKTNLVENAICMTCFETGHTVCPDKRVTQSNRSAERVFCPNCGEPNHSVDFPAPGEYNKCPAPFYEAYGRFPMDLMNMLEDPFHGGFRGRRQHDLYSSLTRYHSDKVTQMFPCLHPPTSTYDFYDERDNSDNNHSNHNRRDNRNTFGQAPRESTKYHSEQFENKNYQGRQVAYSSSSSSSSRQYGRERESQHSGQGDGNRGDHKRFRNNESASRDNTEMHPPKRATYFNHQTDTNEDSRQQSKSGGGGQRGGGGREFVHKPSTSGNSNHNNSNHHSKLLNYNSNRR